MNNLNCIVSSLDVVRPPRATKLYSSTCLPGWHLIIAELRVSCIGAVELAELHLTLRGPAASRVDCRRTGSCEKFEKVFPLDARERGSLQQSRVAGCSSDIRACCATLSTKPLTIIIDADLKRTRYSGTGLRHWSISEELVQIECPPSSTTHEGCDIQNAVAEPELDSKTGSFQPSTDIADSARIWP